jgi:hypothetical protein
MTSDRGNHPFWHYMTSSTSKETKVLIGGQTTVHDLSFWHKILRRDNCTFVLHKDSLSFIGNEHLECCLRVNDN